MGEMGSWRLKQVKKKKKEETNKKIVECFCVEKKLPYFWMEAEVWKAECIL